MKGRRKLARKGLIRFFVVFGMNALLIFLPAGTLVFPEGWSAIGALLIPAFFLGLFLFFRAPERLEKRLEKREEDPAMRRNVFFGAFLYASGLILAGLTRRFHWPTLPFGFRITGILLFLCSILLYALSFRENRYLSRTVYTQEGQTISTVGVYRLVRHPFYLASVCLYASLAAFLNSLFCLGIFLLLPAVLIRRILLEEKMLSERIPAYREYQKKTKYRLIPWIW